MSDRLHQVHIRTPEGIMFSLTLAGPVTRFLAWSIDAAVVGALQALVGSALGWVGLISADIAGAFVYISYFVIGIGYGLGLEWFLKGQTLGKKILRLRVVDERGLRLRASQIVMRNLLRAVDALPAFYLVGGLAMLVSRRSQRLGDFAAGTLVVRHARVVEPDVDQIMAGKYNTFREHPAVEARIRQKIGAPEAGLSLQALLRREEMDDVSRVALFRELATQLRAKAAIPPELVEGLSDEQVVRNAVDSVYRR